MAALARQHERPPRAGLVAAGLLPLFALHVFCLRILMKS